MLANVRVNRACQRHRSPWHGHSRLACMLLLLLLLLLALV